MKNLNPRKDLGKRFKGFVSEVLSHSYLVDVCLRETELIDF
jgi:hypothetical protein